MDIKLPRAKRPFWKSRPFWIIALATSLTGMVVAGLNAKPAGMRVDGAGVSISTVTRGPLVVNVQGSGVLRAQDIRLIAAQSEARVERILVQPGTQVHPGDLIVQLSNPALQQLAQENRWNLDQAEAELRAVRTQLDMEQLNQHSTITRAEFAEQTAAQKLEAQTRLLKEGMVSRLDYQASELNFKQLHETLALERERLKRGELNLHAQIEAREAAISRLRKVLQRAEDMAASLTVRAQTDGIVQDLNLQPGQAVLPGTTLAKLVRPGELYAELQIQESQARDIAVGQPAQIEVRNTPVAAKVIRIAPSVANGTVKVDLSLIGVTPRGARPDLSIDGSIETARIDNTLQVGRPVFAQADSPAYVFKLVSDDTAQRIDVEFGTAAISRIAIKKGLMPGDRIVVSDTSAWRSHDRVRIK